MRSSTKDGNRSPKLAFSHAAIRANHYYPATRTFYRTLARPKPPVVAPVVVAKELARIVSYVLTEQETSTARSKARRRVA